MSGDSTSIMDLPTDPVGGGNITLNASENVVQKQMQMPQQQMPQQMPNQGQTPNFSLDQTTISQIVSGLQQAATAGGSPLTI